MLKPLADRVVLKMTKAEETTKSGIILSEGSKEKPQIAEVIAVGPGGNVDGKEIKMYVKAGDKAVKIALTGENYSFDRNCAVLEDDVLTVLQNTTITQIGLRGFKRILHKNINECFFGFELYKVKDFYILYGETEIIRLDKNFNCVWTFSGIDIFTTLDNTSAFVIDDDRIKLRDFQNNYYEINFDGKLIKKNC